MPTSHIAFLVVYAITVVLLLWAVSNYYVKNRQAKKLSAAVIFSSFWAIAAAVLLLLVVILGYTGMPTFLEAMLAGLGGAALGWLLGMYISPIGASEASAFEKYGTALAGVVSGYGLSSVVHIASNHHAFLLTHWLPLAVFGISTLLSIAAVYNSRAYDNKLIEVHVRGKDFQVSADGALQMPLAEGARTFFAKVIGPSDPAVRWEVHPIVLATYTIDHDLGVLTPIAVATGVKLIATNLEDPSLSNFVLFDIV